jgi:hypothetical protein
MAIRKQLHKLIDNIDDENVLSAYMHLIQSMNGSEFGNLYDDLEPEQKEQLDKSFQRSLNPSNLRSHQDALNALSKWL